MSKQQLSLDFEAGLTGRYPTLMDCVRAAIERSSQQKKSIAADLDKSPSDLARELAENPNDNRYFKVRDLSQLIESCGEPGHDIIYWLIEKHLEDPEVRRQRARDMLTQLLPQLIELIEDAKQ